MDTPDSTLISGRKEAGAKRRWPLLLKLGIVAALLAALLYFLDFKETAYLVTHVSPGYLAAVMALIYVDRALMAYKWGLLLSASGVRAPFFLLFRIYLVSPLVGIVFPSTVGGDLFRLYGLTRHRFDGNTVIASIIAERVIGFVAILALASAGAGVALYLFRDTWVHFREIALVFGIGLLLTATMALAATGASRKAAEKIASRLPALPVFGKLFQAYVIYTEYRRQPRVLAAVSAWTMVEQMVPVIGYLLLALALHVDVSFLKLLAVVPVVLLGARLPISLDGLGVAEGLAVGLFTLVGVSASQALMMAAFARVMQDAAGLPWAVHYLLAGRQSQPKPHTTVAAEVKGGV